MRQAGEITPVSVEHSATFYNNEANYRAAMAIDLDLVTRSYTVAGSDGTIWFKLTLDKVYFVEQVIRYNNGAGTPDLTWTSTNTGCRNCVGEHCSSYTLTVSTEGAVSDLSPVSDCKYGDTVKLERVSGTGFTAREMVIVGQSGNLPFIKIYILHIENKNVFI